MNKLALLLLVACGKSSSPPPPLKRSVDAGASRVAALVERLRGTDRMKAIEELDSAKLTSDEQLELLRATTLDFKEDNEAFSVRTRMVLAVPPDTREIALIEELFPKWPKATQAAGLNLLSRIDHEVAAKAFVRHLPALADADPDMVLGGLHKAPHHAAIIVPALVALKGNDEMRYEAVLTLLDYCDAGQIKPPLLADQAAPLLAEYRHASRDLASVLLDLFRCIPDEDIAEELTATLANRDPRLVYFAAKSLAAFGRDIPAATYAKIAASPEMRMWLIEDLEKQGQLAKLPARYRTQVAIAEAEMVRWLMFPTELGHAPEAIKLGKIVTSMTADGPLDTYVFKLKTEDGWIAGIAGPYLRKEQPTTHSYGGTFSAFEAWGAKTPEQHAARIQKIVDDWQRVRK